MSETINQDQQKNSLEDSDLRSFLPSPVSIDPEKWIVMLTQLGLFVLSDSEFKAIKDHYDNKGVRLNEMTLNNIKYVIKPHTEGVYKFAKDEIIYALLKYEQIKEISHLKKIERIFLLNLPSEEKQKEVRVPYITTEQVYAHVYENSEGNIYLYVMKQRRINKNEEEEAECILAIPKMQEKGDLLKRMLENYLRSNIRPGAKHWIQTYGNESKTIGWEEIFALNDEGLRKRYDEDNCYDYETDTHIAYLSQDKEVKFYKKRMREASIKLLFYPNN